MFCGHQKELEKELLFNMVTFGIRGWIWNLSSMKGTLGRDRSQDSCHHGDRAGKSLASHSGKCHSP